MEILDLNCHPLGAHLSQHTRYWETGEGLTIMGLYVEALPKRGTFFRLVVYDTREVISLVEVYERVGKSVIVVCKKAQKG